MHKHVQKRLGEWLDGLALPPLESPRRQLEELQLGVLRNFFLLLLAREPERLSTTPSEALRRWASHLKELERYCTILNLPLQGTPDDIVDAIKLSDGELFALQQKLLDELTTEGRRLIVELGRLF